MDRVIEVAGIREVLYRPIGELSKGYRQRVGIAQALLHDPEILILDEPTSGLDPTQIVEIRQLIKELGKEKTIILSTHILPEVSVTSTRVLIINRGTIVASGTADELAQKSTDRMVLRVEIKANPEDIESTFEETPWVESWTRSGESDGAFTYTIKGPKNEDIRGKVFNLAKEKGWTLLELWRERATLEEVFLKLTTEEA
jgi:ABC-2 type transport system ATP-binding protein